MSDWLAANNDETGLQAKGWNNNGMAPWPRRVQRPPGSYALDTMPALGGRWPPNIPLDSTSSRHCWDCMKVVPWYSGMTWADHKAECAGAPLRGHKAPSPVSDVCYWCAQTVEGCICGPVHSSVQADMNGWMDFSCEVMRFCDW